MENKELQTSNRKNYPVVVDTGEFSGYLDSNKFEHSLRVANMFASSQLVPKHFQGKQADCMIAFNQAIRLKVDPMLFMQKTFVVHGKLGIESQLAIALVNRSGTFQDVIQFEYSGEKTKTGDTRQCKAYAVTVNGAKCFDICSVQEAKDMGWWNMNALWPKMTSTFLAYRSAMKMIRKYCPEILMGMDTTEELRDTRIVNITSEIEEAKASEILNLKKVETQNNVSPFVDTPEKIVVKKTEQPSVKQILHPKTELLKKYFEDDAYLEVFDMLEETETVTKQKVKAVILDDASKEAVTILNEIEKIT